MRVTIAPVKLRRDALLHTCPELRIGIGLPAPLSGRLDVLVELADAEGAKTSRKEVLAALLLSASDDGDALAGLVRDYRKASIAQAMISSQSEARFLDPQRPAPGPRPRGRDQVD
jgi:hypothetical protein